MDVKRVLFVFGLTLSACAVAEKEARNVVEPEYLDMLLKEKRYQEFNKIMDIEHHHLSFPRAHNASHDPRFNKELFQGDILLTSAQLEQARQGIDFTTHPTYKWSYVPYAVSDKFNSANRTFIEQCIRKFNKDNNYCIVWIPRTGEDCYVYFYPGDGCFSHIGRTGKTPQPLSLAERGCLSQGTVLHEMNHAIGFMHEQCRWDRDEYIDVKYENMAESWHSQFTKTSKEDFGSQGPYDYYSLMHYPKWHRDLCISDKPAFAVLAKGIDEEKIGHSNDFTEIDRQKIAKQYCPDYDDSESDYDDSESDYSEE